MDRKPSRPLVNDHNAPVAPPFAASPPEPPPAPEADVAAPLLVAVGAPGRFEELAEVGEVPQDPAGAEVAVTPEAGAPPDEGELLCAGAEDVGTAADEVSAIPAVPDVPMGLTTSGPTRTGPTCTGPTVSGAGNPSVAPGGVEEVAGGAVAESCDEFAGGGASTREVSAGGATLGREAVGVGGAPVCCDVARSFEGAGGWIGSTVLADVDALA